MLYDLRFDSVTRPGEPPPPLSRVDLQLTSLAVGTFVQGPCNRVIAEPSGGGSLMDSFTGPGNSTVTIVGNDSTHLWGSFSAKVCRVAGSTVVNGQTVNTYACEHIVSAAFSARVEGTDSDTQWGPPPGLCN